MKDLKGVEVGEYSRLAIASKLDDSNNQLYEKHFLGETTSVSSGPGHGPAVCNILTIDIEDYFHPSEAKNYIGAEAWAGSPSRVHFGMEVLLDSMEAAGVRSTCFILGWIAEKHPELVRRIAKAGHEIACHSYAHELVYELTPQQFREDTIRAVAAIEDACGITPRMYRAPSCSITEKSKWALEVLVECGFTHDSSIYPVTHDRYGVPGSPRGAHVIETPSGPIREVPIATVDLGGGVVSPVGGGAYLRLFPYRYTAAGIRKMNKTEQMPACLYVHPWEFDPHQPRLIKGALGIIRTYTGLKGMEAKFNRLIRDFRFAPMGQVIPA